MSERPRRRSSRQGSLTTIFWIDIPAQVTARRSGRTEKVLLSARFQHAIDRAAAVADKTETQAYVAEWRRVDVSIDGDLLAAAEAVAAELEADYSRERLEALVASGGVDPAAAGA